MHAHCLQVKVSAPEPCVGQTHLRPMNPICLHQAGQNRVGGNEQVDLPVGADLSQVLRDFLAIIRSEMPVNDAEARWQRLSDSNGIRYTVRVRQKQNTRQVRWKMPVDLPYRGSPLASNLSLVFQPGHEFR